eukprot:5675509-Pleurochrysis_carterae.AAC.2
MRDARCVDRSRQQLIRNGERIVLKAKAEIEIVRITWRMGGCVLDGILACNMLALVRSVAPSRFPQTPVQEQQGDKVGKRSAGSVRAHLSRFTGVSGIGGTPPTSVGSA